MAVGLAGLEEDVIDPNFHVHQGAPTSTAFQKCWKKGGHGSVDLKTAIAQSCDASALHCRQHAWRRSHQQVGTLLEAA